MRRLQSLRRVDRGFILVLAIAIAARVIAVVQAQQAPFWSAAVMDETAYMRLAVAMLAGNAPPHGAYYQAPGYGYFLAAIHGLGGGIVAVKLVQLTLGVLNSLLVWRLGWKYFGAREAIVAGGLWAIYPIALFHEVLVLKPTLAVSLSLLALVVMHAPVATSAPKQNRARLSWSPTRRCAASGFLFGLASLVQAEIAGVALLLWVVAVAPWRRKTSGVTGRRAAAKARPASPATTWIAGIGAVSFLLVLAIPTLQNIARGGGFVVLAYGSGTNFFIGNHAGADGSYVGLRPFRSDPTFEESDAVEMSAAAMGRAPRPTEVSRYWWMRGLAWWREQPWAALRLIGRSLSHSHGIVRASIKTPVQTVHADFPHTAFQ